MHLVRLGIAYTRLEILLSRVLITGISGHLGQRLSRLLVDDSNIDLVVGVDVRLPRFPLQDFVFEKCDLTHPTWVGEHIQDYRIDTVVHLGWDRGNWGGNPSATNIDGTLHVLKGVAKSNVKRIIFASSDAVYGYIPRDENPLRENTPMVADQTFPDAWNLVQVEQMLKIFAEHQPKVEQTVLRFGPILGRDSHEPSVEMLRHNRLLREKDTNTQFGFISSEDAAAALATAVTAKRTGIFNAVGQGTLSVEEVAQVLGKTVEVGTMRSLRRFLSRQQLMGRPALDPDQVAMAIYRPQILPNSLRSTLGFRPRETSAEALSRWVKN